MFTSKVRRYLQGLIGRNVLSFRLRKALWIMVGCMSIVCLYNLWNNGRYPLYEKQSQYVSERQITYESILSKWGPVRGMQKPKRDVTGDNVLRYIWFNCKEFHFYNLLSLISVYRIMKPRTIYFHADCEPTGQWWEEARKIPTLQYVDSIQPKTVFLQNFSSSFDVHRTDVAKVLVLMAHGGVVIDPDVFVLKSLRPLRHYKFVMGVSGDDRRLSNSVMISVRDSLFLRLYYGNYRSYAKDCLLCNSILYPTMLAHERNASLHTIHFTLDGLMKNKRKVKPGELEMRKSVMLAESAYFVQFPVKPILEMFNPTSIKTMDNIAGAMARYIYYGSRGLIAKDIDPKPWWTSIPANSTNSLTYSNSTLFHNTTYNDHGWKNHRSGQRKSRRKRQNTKAFIHPKNYN